MLPTILTVAACGSAAQADRLRVQDRCRAGRGIFRKGSAPPRSARNGRARSPLRASTFNRERVLTLHAVSILGYDMPVDRIASRIQGRWDRHDETLLILGVCPRHAGRDYFPALVLEFQARKFCDHAFAEVELYLGRRASAWNISRRTGRFKCGVGTGMRSHQGNRDKRERADGDLMPQHFAFLP